MAAGGKEAVGRGGVGKWGRWGLGAAAEPFKSTSMRMPWVGGSETWRCGA